MGSAQGHPIKALRGLHGQQAGTFRRTGDQAGVVHQLDRVRDGQAGHDRLMPGVQGVQNPHNQGRVHKGSGRVVHEHAPAVRGQGGQTVAHRFLPGRPAARQAALQAKPAARVEFVEHPGMVVRVAFRRKNEHDARDSGHPCKDPGAVPKQRSALEAEKLFGRRARGITA